MIFRDTYAAEGVSKTYLNEMYEFVTQDASGEVANPGTQAYLLNSHGKSLTVPTAWGASNNFIFAGGGGTYRAPYTTKPDGALEIGIGLGDTKKTLGTQISMVSLDLSGWKRYALYLHLSKDLSNSAAIGAGVENVVLAGVSDADKSFYAVYSKAVESDPFINNVTGRSKLYYTFGVGSGRFGNKPPSDTKAGKGAHGTYAFGSVAYEVASTLNVIAAWNGINLSTGISKTFWIDEIPIATVLGVSDLTSNSGTGARITFGFGTGFEL